MANPIGVSLDLIVPPPSGGGTIASGTTCVRRRVDVLSARNGGPGPTNVSLLTPLQRTMGEPSSLGFLRTEADPQDEREEPA